VSDRTGRISTGDSGQSALIAEGIYDYLIEQASIGMVRDLLIPGADVIRLYDHIPCPEIVWWGASVPLSRHGPNRSLQVQNMAFDVEMTRADFLDAVDELDRGSGGLMLVQSSKPLPTDIHPRRFRNQETLLRVLRNNGACLLFELPHQHETAGLTVFGKRNFEHLVANGIIEVDDGEDETG
jgi:hypothetical protein